MREHFSAEDPLVRQVVDGEYGAHAGERGVVAEPFPHVGGHKPGLPVVGVHHRGLHAGVRGALEGGAREQAEPQVIVGEVAARVRVQVLPIVVGRAVHEPEPHAIVVDAFEDAELGCAKPRAAPEGRDGPPFGNAPIARRDHGDAVAEVRQRGRERAAHVPQAARFRVRNRLGHDHEDVEHLLHSRRGARAPVSRS